MKGIYLLYIEINKDIKTKIGALGEIEFQKGSYVYVGSAQNNLKKRVERHLSEDKKLHWHIDYLLQNENVNIVDVYTKEADRQHECLTANALKGKPVKNFGCSDCRCESHLIRIDDSSFSN